MESSVGWLAAVSDSRRDLPAFRNTLGAVESPTPSGPDQAPTRVLPAGPCLAGLAMGLDRQDLDAGLLR